MRRAGNVFLLLILLGITAVFAFYRISEQSFDPDSDEIIHIRVVQDLVRSGDPLHLTHGGAPYYNKPPLKFWAAGLAVKLFGESNLTHRLVDGLCGIGVAALTALAGALLLRNGTGGVLAGLILLGNASWVFGRHGIRRGTLEAMLVFWTTAAAVVGVLIVRQLWSGRDERLKVLGVGFGLTTGLAILTKSLAGAVPWLVIAPSLAWLFLKKGPSSLRGWFLPAVVLTVTVPGWYFAYHALFSPGFWARAVEIELVERMTVGFHNASDWSYYLRQLFFEDVAGPGCLLAIGLGYCSYSAVRHRSAESAFLVSWFAVPVVLLSVVKSRLFWYIAPTFPAAALLIAAPIVASAQVSLRKGTTAIRRSGAALFFAASLMLFVPTVNSAVDNLLEQHTRLRADVLFGGVKTAATQSARFKMGELGPTIDRSANPLPGKFNVEGLYMAMIDSLVRPVTLGGGAEPSIGMKDSVSDADMVLFGEDKLSEMLSARQGVRSYLVLRPYRLRRQHLMALYFGDATVPGFTPVRRRLTCDDDTSLRGAIGVLPPERSDFGTICYNSSSRMVFARTGDFVMQKLGTKERLNIGFMDAKRELADVTATVTLNDVQLATSVLRPNDFTSIDYAVPAGVWEQGENVFSIVLKAPPNGVSSRRVFVQQVEVEVPPLE